MARPEYAQGQYSQAISEAFLECDRVMRTEESLKDEMAVLFIGMCVAEGSTKYFTMQGCTAVTVWTRGKELWCANAGDSRCVAGVGGVARPLSQDHKPMDEKEKARIEAAGGFVEFNRVNGNLALSRWHSHSSYLGIKFFYGRRF